MLVAAVASAASTRRGARGRPTSPAASDLVGTEWLLEDLGGRRVLDDAQSTIAFQAGGRITGNGGCNRYFGPARISGGRIEIEHLGSTRMACPPAVMDQEHRFLDALQKATRLERNGAFLLIHSAGLDEPLKFTRLGGQGAAPAERRQASLGGVVTYRQRGALPPDAEAQVQLIDASLADAPAEALAEQKHTDASGAPGRRARGDRGRGRTGPVT
jgi:heat shock protein HslJ